MKMNKKGFTLAELLIVVAIIAVLVAIAIPVFTTQLERSRETTDYANLRAAYAAGTTTALTGYIGEDDVSADIATDAGKTYYYAPGKNGSLSVAEADGATIGQGTTTDGKGDKSGLPSVCSYDNNTNYKGHKIEVTIKKGIVDSVKFGA